MPDLSSHKKEELWNCALIDIYRYSLTMILQIMEYTQLILRLSPKKPASIFFCGCMEKQLSVYMWGKPLSYEIALKRNSTIQN